MEQAVHSSFTQEFLSTAIRHTTASGLMKKGKQKDMSRCHHPTELIAAEAVARGGSFRVMACTQHQLNRSPVHADELSASESQ